MGGRQLGGMRPLFDMDEIPIGVCILLFVASMAGIVAALLPMRLLLSVRGRIVLVGHPSGTLHISVVVAGGRSWKVTPSRSGQFVVQLPLRSVAVMQVVLAGHVVREICLEQSGTEKWIRNDNVCRHLDLGDLVLDGAVDSKTSRATATVTHVITVIEHNGLVRYAPLDHQMLDRAHRMIGPVQTRC